MPLTILADAPSGGFIRLHGTREPGATVTVGRGYGSFPFPLFGVAACSSVAYMGSAPAGLTITDTFNQYTSNNMALSAGEWLTLAGAAEPRAYKGIVYGPPGGGVLRLGEWGANQHSEYLFDERVTVWDGAIVLPGVVVRASGSRTEATYYVAQLMGDATDEGVEVRLSRFVAGVETVLQANDGSHVDYENQRAPWRLRLAVDGSTLTVSVNGTTHYSVVDTGIASGSPGFLMGPMYCSSNYITSWTGSCSL